MRTRSPRLYGMPSSHVLCRLVSILQLQCPYRRVHPRLDDLDDERHLLVLICVLLGILTRHKLLVFIIVIVEQLLLFFDDELCCGDDDA
jgi:hypothetical protein